MQRRPANLAAVLVAGAAMILTTAAADTAPPAVPAATPERRPAVLFAGYPHSSCGYEVAGRLQRDGFDLRGLGWPALQSHALTWEELSRYNAVVLTGLGLANADGSLPEHVRNNIELLRRFVNEGGGVLVIPHWGQMDAGIPPQRELFAPWGLTALFNEVPFDPDTAVTATAWALPFALATDVADSPVTAGVKALRYPVATRAGAQNHTTTFQLSPEWQVLLRGARSAQTRRIPTDEWNPAAAPAGTYAAGVPLAAARELGKGRLVVLGITPEYLFSNVAMTTLEGIVLERGFRGTASDGYALVRNALRWLAEPSLAAGTLGGAGMDEALLRNPHKTQFGKPYDWAAGAAPPSPLPARPGVIGARTAFSTGSGNVAEWVAAAKAAGLPWLVFLEEFGALTRDEFAQLKRECAAATTAEFAAVPGFTIDDEVGNHYFYFGTTLPWPDAKYLSDDGKVFVSYDTGLDPANPRVKGQLAMTTLFYAYQVGGFKLTAGNYLFRGGAAPFAHWYSNYDAAAVLTARNGAVVEDATAEYLQLVAAGQGPVPLVVDLLDAPAGLAATPWRTVLRLPADGGSTVGDALAGKNLAAEYWNTWHFYPDNPTRIYVSDGPEIVAWSFSGPRDYGGDNPDDFVWQNHRWLVHGEVRAAGGLRSVEIFDGPRLFRRFLPGDRREFAFTLDLTHERQHNLVLVVTDAAGRRAIAGEQWDRNHRLEEFNCSDRNNQLSYGYTTRRDGTGLMIGGNQTLATPNKRMGGLELSPSGTFRNDAFLGAPAFDGGAGGEPVVFGEVRVRPAAAGAPAPAVPPVCEARRLLHTGDVNIGEGRYAHRFTDDIRAANVWHTLWRTRPADDLVVTKRNHFFQLDPDSPLAVALWRTTVTLQKDLPNHGLVAAFIRAGQERLWALRGSDGTVAAGLWEENPLSAGRTVLLPCEPGGYAALLDSPLGGCAVFPLTPGLEVSLGQPGRTNVYFHLPAARTPQNKGEVAQIDLLLVGIPRATALTRNLPAPTTEVVERFRREFGLGDGPPAYQLTVRAGSVTGQRFILAIDGARDGGFDGALGGKLISALPITVSGLRDHWSAVLYDRGRGKARPLGVFEGTAWATVVLPGDLDLFIGHPVLCDRPELALQVTQSGADAWSIELHNPTDAAVTAVLRPNPLFEPLAKKPLAPETVQVPAGASVTRNW